MRLTRQTQELHIKVLEHRVRQCAMPLLSVLFHGSMSHVSKRVSSMPAWSLEYFQKVLEDLDTQKFEVVTSSG